VDGTNVVRVLWGYSPAFQEQEESDCATLVAAFGALCKALAGDIEVEVFFDGQARDFDPRRLAAGLPANLRVRFSWEESADELILDRIRARRWNSAGGAAVVTADSDLGRRARAEGARWLQVRDGDALDRILNSVERRFTR
jgi:hypothetical protein